MTTTEPRYCFQDLSGTHTLTRSEILAEYFAYWSDQMRKVGKSDLISESACIDDWIVVHWAWEIVEPDPGIARYETPDRSPAIKRRPRNDANYGQGYARSTTRLTTRRDRQWYGRVGNHSGSG